MTLNSRTATLIFFLLAAALGPLDASAAPTPGAGVTLEQGFEAALRRSEVIASQAEELEQSRERHEQAKGAILPSVNLLASYTRQEEPALSIGRSFSPSSQPSFRINALQPVFRGFREYAGLKQTRLLAEATEATLFQARTELFVDFASNFLNVASLERDLENLDAELKLYDDRLRELRARVKIGRSRASEVLTIEASRATVLAQKEQTRAQMLAARELFHFLTGLPMESPIAAKPEPAFAGKPPGMETFLETIETRPDVRALRAQQEASDAAVDVAWGAHLPSIDLQGNYWLKRAGANENVSWDIQASLSFPIFAGGTIQSRVRESASDRKQAELALERARRAADQEIRALYQVVRTDQEQIQALTLATEASEKAYRQQRRDYELGLVTNLDVLQALASSQSSRRSLDRALFSAQLNRLRLEAAAAIRPSRAP